MTARAAIAAFVSAILFAAPAAFAQFDYSPETGSLTIVASPTNPTPGQSVQLTVQSSDLNLSASTVSWTVNGNSAGSGESITIKVGALGTASNVAVSVSGVVDDSAQISIIPTSIDLLWEANSYTPAFYSGRALPSPGSVIDVVAMPHFVEPDGSSIAAANLIYTWKINGGVVASDSGVGKSSALIPAAILYGSDTITVDAQTQDGSLSGEASITVPTEDPSLVLYENNPLFGIMFHQALGGQTAASDAETSFVAVPYFANASSPTNTNLNYAWSVNDAPVVSDTKNPNEITLSAQSAGTAQIALSLSDLSNPFVSASGAWSVSFSSGSITPQDAFHASSQ